MRSYRMMFLGLAVLAGSTTVASLAHGQSSDSPRVKRAIGFLDTEKRSKFILGYMHMGGTYKGHDVIGTVRVVDKDGDTIPGYFGVKVVYDWTTAFGDNTTTAVFFFDEIGTIVDIKCKTTSIFNQPFDLASATLNALGNVIIQAFGDEMSADDRRNLQSLVDGSDAKGLAIWALNLQQKLGR